MDPRSGITSDPNLSNDPQYIARLVGRVVQVSVETVRLVRELATTVSLDSVIGAAAVEARGQEAEEGPGGLPPLGLAGCDRDEAAGDASRDPRGVAAPPHAGARVVED